MNTRERLLAVALQIFADEGFDGLDARTLTSRAKANLAAIGYHFQGKVGLYRAVLRQSVLPLCETLTDQLLDFDAGFYSVESVVDAYLAVADSADGSASRLFRRCLTEPAEANVPPDDVVPFERTLGRLSQAFRRLAPRMPAAAFLWRFTLFLGAANHALDSLPRMPELTRGICPPDDHSGARTELLILAASLFSPAA